MAERLALPTTDHGVAGSNPAGGEILPERRFMAQSLSCSPFHCLEMAEILLKGHKTLTHPSIQTNFSGLVSVFGGLCLNLGNVRAGRILHFRFVRNVLASPMSFFDKTPTGRILNRFGKDLDVVDNVMSPLVHIWLWCLLNTFSTPFVISYSTPMFLTVMAPLFIAYLIIQVSIL